MGREEAKIQLKQHMRENNIWDQCAGYILENGSIELPYLDQQMLCNDFIGPNKQERCAIIMRKIDDFSHSTQQELLAAHAQLKKLNERNRNFLNFIANLIDCAKNLSLNDASHDCDASWVLDKLQEKNVSQHYRDQLTRFICYSDNIEDFTEAKNEKTWLAFMRLCGIMHLLTKTKLESHNKKLFDTMAVLILNCKKIELTLTQIICCGELYDDVDDLENYYTDENSPFQILLKKGPTLESSQREQLITELGKMSAEDTAADDGQARVVEKKQEKETTLPQQSWDQCSVLPICGILAGTGLVAFGIFAFCVTIGAAYISTLLGSTAIPLGLFLLGYSAAACDKNFKIMASLFGEQNANQIKANIALHF